MYRRSFGSAIFRAQAVRVDVSAFARYASVEKRVGRVNYLLVGMVSYSSRTLIRRAGVSAMINLYCDFPFRYQVANRVFARAEL